MKQRDKSMKMRRFAIGCGLALLPVVASANLVTIDWFGTVNGAHSNIHSPGTWYETGDRISGTFTIDTQYSSGQSNFVTSNRPQYDHSLDNVSVNDGGGSFDSMSVLDYETREFGEPGSANRLVLWEYATIGFASAVDFLNGNGLEQSFDLSSFTWGSGEMISQAWWQVDFEPVYPRESYVHFSLDRVVARVPEPATGCLLFAGMLGCLLARSRASASDSKSSGNNQFAA